MTRTTRKAAVETRGRPATPADTQTFLGQVGARIRAAREKKRLSVEEAAARAGLPAPSWYRWERGRLTQLEKLPAIAAALGVTARSLIP